MYLENLVFDAVDPGRLGRFWEAALGGVRLTDEPDAFETRLSAPGGPDLDLCFQRVSDPPHGRPRLHLDLRGGADLSAVVERLLRLGARRADIGQGDVAWVVLADPEGNPFCVVEARDAPEGTGPVAEVPVDSADPDRDGAFWRGLTGWVAAPGEAPCTLQHPSGRGLRLGWWPEQTPKDAAKNRLHLDLRLDRGDDADAVTRRIEDAGGRELDPGWGDLPWRVFADPSGNEFCLLPARG